MTPAELTFTRAQHYQSWTVPYSDGVRSAACKDVPHILASHAVLHAAKSVGKLATEMEKADHGFLVDEQAVAAMSADLVTAALRLANLYGFDLAAVLCERVAEKNGVSLMD